MSQYIWWVPEALGTKHAKSSDCAYPAVIRTNCPRRWFHGRILQVINAKNNLFEGETGQFWYENGVRKQDSIHSKFHARETQRWTREMVNLHKLQSISLHFRCSLTDISMSNSIWIEKTHVWARLSKIDDRFLLTTKKWIESLGSFYFCRTSIAYVYEIPHSQPHTTQMSDCIPIASYKWENHLICP